MNGKGAKYIGNNVALLGNALPLQLSPMFVQVIHE